MKVLLAALAVVAVLSSGCARSASTDQTNNVPAVVGMSLEQARGAIGAAGFRVGKVTPKWSKWSGIVSAQALELYREAYPGKDPLAFGQLLTAYVLDRLLQTGEVSLDEGRIVASDLGARPVRVLQEE